MKGNKIVEITTLIEYLTGRKVYIVGYGNNGKKIAIFLEKKNINYEGFVDKNVSGHDNSLKKIISYREVDANAIYLVSSHEHEKEMADELLRFNVKPENIILMCSSGLFLKVLDSIYDYNEIYSPMIKCFKGIHKDKICFLIGNGPSLRTEDLDILKEKDIISFASNSIYNLYDYTGWRPTYYFSFDPIMTNGILISDMENALDGVELMFTSINSKMIDLQNKNKIRYLRTRIEKDCRTNLPKFSLECDDFVYLSGTVMYQMLQMAIYMGFREIYLLGVDCSYALEKETNGEFESKEVLNHNYIIERKDEELIEQNRIPECWADVNMQINGYKSAKKISEMLKVKIFNATRGGKLEVFERVDFDNLFN